MIFFISHFNFLQNIKEILKGEFDLLIAALIFSAGYYSAPIFFTIQRIWIVLGRCLFKDLFTYFHDFWSQIGVVILVTPKQEVERKSEWFCGVNFFLLEF